jgi:hypothetical protein
MALMFMMTGVNSYSQQKAFEYYVPFYGFTDNREYTNTVHPPQTIFGARISPEFGILMDSAHRFRVGAHIMKEFGSGESNFQVNPILYYQYVDKRVDFYMGMFPRMGLLDRYPLALLNDTLRYYRPNVEGILLKVKLGRGYQSAWIDWTSRQTEVQRETFLTGFAGRAYAGRFFFVDYFALYHYAGPAVDLPDDHIRDNAALLLRAGYDLSGKTFFDSLSVSVSYLQSFDRLRNVYDWQTPNGFQYEVFLKKGNFFCNALFYSGDRQSIAYGDSFYKAPVYGRSDFGYQFFDREFVKVRFVYSIHYVEEQLDNQQLLTVLFKTGGSSRLKR